jgi:polysaccharide pyruvyl transferase WcaK-like protein
MHDDARQALVLGELASYCKQVSVPCFLINSVWQRNDKLNGLAADFTGIYVRDHLSAEELQRLGLQVSVVPDLTLTFEAAPESTGRSGGIVNGNVYAARTLEAWAAVQEAKSPAINYLSIKTLPVIQFGKRFPVYVFKSLARRLKAERYWLSSRLRGLPSQLGENDLGRLRWRYSSRSLHAFLARLGAAEWVVTGRFHCVTLCMLMRTPFIAVASNTHKIEALLQAAGLVNRMSETYRDAVTRGSCQPFSQEEQANLEAFLIRCRLQAGNMFEEIARTAKEGRQQ